MNDYCWSYFRPPKSAADFECNKINYKRLHHYYGLGGKFSAQATSGQKGSRKSTPMYNYIGFQTGESLDEYFGKLYLAITSYDAFGDFKFNDLASFFKL